MSSRRDSSTYYHIAGANTYQLNTGRGVLRQIIFNTPIALSTVKIIDNTAGTTANIGTITNTAAVEPYSVWYNCEYKTGLRIITSGADDITVVFD